MYSVTKVINFCYGHRLLDYEGKCRYLHGHNGKVEIELASETLDRRGMVRDFNEIKHTIQDWIDRKLDHTMLLNRRDPLLPLLQQRGEPVFVMEVNPTAETIAALIFTYATAQGFPVTAVRLWETDSAAATYRRPDAAAAPRRAGRAARRPSRARARRSTSTAA